MGLFDLVKGWLFWEGRENEFDFVGKLKMLVGYMVVVVVENTHMHIKMLENLFGHKYLDKLIDHIIHLKYE